MSAQTERRLFRVWLMLSAVTLLTWFLGSERGASSATSHAVITYSALLIAAFKVRMIVVEFMEARRASKTMQVVMDTWLLLLVAGLMAIYALELDVPPV